jgi:hypothetical protein
LWIKTSHTHKCLCLYKFCYWKMRSAYLSGTLSMMSSVWYTTISPYLWGLIRKHLNVLNIVEKQMIYIICVQSYHIYVIWIMLCDEGIHCSISPAPLPVGECHLDTPQPHPARRATPCHGIDHIACHQVIINQHSSCRS